MSHCDSPSKTGCPSPTIREGDGDTFKLSDANLATLLEVNELPDEVLRPLLFSTLVLLFSKAATEQAEAPGERSSCVVAPRLALLPLPWCRRKALWM